MSHSSRVRLRDMRQIYLTLGECSELGADPIAWRRHLLSSLLRMLGAQASIHSESEIVAPMGQVKWLQPVLLENCGCSSDLNRLAFERFLAQQQPDYAPFVAEMFAPPCRLRVFHAYGDLGKGRWHSSQFYNEIDRPARLDDWFHAHHLTDEGRAFWISVCRAVGDSPFSERQRRIVKILFGEVVNSLGSRLANSNAPSVLVLPTRLQQVLYWLLRGASEKQVALRLGLSVHTVHQYVKDLHLRFQARSRGELLSRTMQYWAVLDRIDAGGVPQN